MRGGGFKTQEGTFRLDTGMMFFTVGTGQDRHRLPGEVVDVPSLGTLRVRLGGALDPVEEVPAHCAPFCGPYPVPLGSARALLARGDRPCPAFSQGDTGRQNAAGTKQGLYLWVTPAPVGQGRTFRCRALSCARDQPIAPLVPYYCFPLCKSFV